MAASNGLVSNLRERIEEGLCDREAAGHVATRWGVHPALLEFLTVTWLSV